MVEKVENGELLLKISVSLGFGRAVVAKRKRWCTKMSPSTRKRVEMGVNG
jgi:hypothetical protein